MGSNFEAYKQQPVRADKNTGYYYFDQIVKALTKVTFEAAKHSDYDTVADLVADQPRRYRLEEIVRPLYSKEWLKLKPLEAQELLVSQRFKLLNGWFYTPRSKKRLQDAHTTCELVEQLKEITHREQQRSLEAFRRRWQNCWRWARGFRRQANSDFINQLEDFYSQDALSNNSNLVEAQQMITQLRQYIRNGDTSKIASYKDTFATKKQQLQTKIAQLQNEPGNHPGGSLQQQQTYDQLDQLRWCRDLLGEASKVLANYEKSMSNKIIQDPLTFNELQYCFNHLKQLEIEQQTDNLHYQFLQQHGLLTYWNDEGELVECRTNEQKEQFVELILQTIRKQLNGQNDAHYTVTDSMTGHDLYALYEQCLHDYKCFYTTRDFKLEKKLDLPAQGDDNQQGQNQQSKPVSAYTKLQTLSHPYFYQQHIMQRYADLNARLTEERLDLEQKHEDGLVSRLYCLANSLSKDSNYFECWQQAQEQLYNLYKDHPNQHAYPLAQFLIQHFFQAYQWRPPSEEDKAHIEHLVKQGLPVDSLDEKGECLMHVSAKQFDKRLMTLLYCRGASPIVAHPASQPDRVIEPLCFVGNSDDIDLKNIMFRFAQAYRQDPDLVFKLYRFSGQITDHVADYITKDGKRGFWQRLFQSPHIAQSREKDCHDLTQTSQQIIEQQDIDDIVSAIDTVYQKAQQAPRGWLGRSSLYDSLMSDYRLIRQLIYQLSQPLSDDEKAKRDQLINEQNRHYQFVHENCERPYRDSNQAQQNAIEAYQQEIASLRAIIANSNDPSISQQVCHSNNNLGQEQSNNQLRLDTAAAGSASANTESASAVSAYDTSCYSVSRFLVWGSINSNSDWSAEDDQRRATYQ